MQHFVRCKEGVVWLLPVLVAFDQSLVTGWLDLDVLRRHHPDFYRVAHRPHDRVQVLVASHLQERLAKDVEVVPVVER